MKYDDTIALIESYLDAIDDLDKTLLNIPVADLKKKAPEIAKRLKTQKPQGYRLIAQACRPNLQEITKDEAEIESLINELYDVLGPLSEFSIEGKKIERLLLEEAANDKRLEEAIRELGRCLRKEGTTDLEASITNWYQEYVDPQGKIKLSSRAIWILFKILHARDISYCKEYKRHNKSLLKKVKREKKQKNCTSLWKHLSRGGPSSISLSPMWSIS